MLMPCTKTTPCYLSIFARLWVLSLPILGWGAATTHADVVVNPDNNGFTDVGHGADPLSATLLTNPLSNTLNLGSDNLYVGNSGDGELKLFNPGGFAGVVLNADGFVGHDVGAVGKVTVENASVWSNVNLTVGKEGTGTLDVLVGGTTPHSGSVTIGDALGSMGTINVDGSNARLNTNTSQQMRVGKSGTGFLHVSDGGVVSNEDGEGFVGDEADGVGTVTVDGAGSMLDINFLFVGNFGEGSLDVTGGGVVTNDAIAAVGTESDSMGQVTVDGAGSRWDAGRIIVGINGGDGTLDVTGGAEVTISSSSGMQIGVGPDSMGAATIDGIGSMLTVSGGLDVGQSGGTGSLEITGGAVVDVAGILNMAEDGPGTASTITVDGPGSQLHVGGGLLLSFFGPNTQATLDVRNGGFVSTADLIITLDEPDDTFGRVIVQSGGELHVGGNAFILGELTMADGTVTFAGDREYDPLNGSPSNNVNGVLMPRGGLLSLGEHLKVEGQLTVLSPITIDGGALSAGTIPNLPMVDLVRGTLELTATDVDVTDAGQFGDMITLDSDQHLKIGQTLSVLGDGQVQLTGGRLGAGLLENSGLVSGDGRIDGTVQNAAGGEIRVALGETLRFTGAANTNAGDFDMLAAEDVLGAVVQFDQDLTNLPTGQITGRGTLVTGSGLTNQGELLFSGGFTDVFGPVTQSGGQGSIIASSGGVATFYDDVVHNGAEIRASTDTTITFFGNVSGAGNFTGTGTMNFEGELAPGNSTAAVDFETDVILAAGSTLAIELAGDGDVAGTDFDQVNVMGDILLAGDLSIELLDGFVPTELDMFTVLTAGDLSGAFTNVAAGARLATVDGEGTFLVSYDGVSDAVVLSDFLAGLAGDYNNDGVVNVADYNSWRDNVGASAGTLPNDVDGGVIGQAQYATWKASFGNTLPPPSALREAAIPEPGAFALAGIGLVVLSILRHRHIQTIRCLQARA